MIFLLIIAGTAILTYIAYGLELTQRTTYLTVVETARQQTRGNALLRRIVPSIIADRLQDRLDLREEIVQRYDSVTVLFADLVGFSQLTTTASPESQVTLLSSLFSQLDVAATESGVEKIKTIGYTYMAVAGVPDHTIDHIQRMAGFALEVRSIVRKFSALNGINLQVKIGMHCGPVVAGVIGTTRFNYDLWGETVNTASRLESHDVMDAIQISAEIKAGLGDSYEYSDRGLVALKGMEPRRLFLLNQATSNHN